MRALFWNGTEARIVDRPEPQAAEDIVVVRVALAGICNTDLELVKGYMGFTGVLGHELVGTVLDGPEHWQGQRVVCEINFGCGRCPLCARRLRRHCPNRRVMGILNVDGAFAELVAVPVANLHMVPDNVPDEAAVFTEPLAAAFEILEQIDLPPDTEAVVLGDGKLGLLVAQVLHQAGARVLAVGKHDAKLDLLRRRGIEAVTTATWQPAAADLVVEATGTADGFNRAVETVRPRGTIILKSTVAAHASLNLAPLVINEITLIGSRCGLFAPALDALEAGTVDVQALVSAEVPLAQAAEGLRLAAQPGMLKVLIRNE